MVTGYRPLANHPAAERASCPNTSTAAGLTFRDASRARRQFATFVLGGTVARRQCSELLARVKRRITPLALILALNAYRVEHASSVTNEIRQDGFEPRLKFGREPDVSHKVMRKRAGTSCVMQ